MMKIRTTQNLNSLRYDSSNKPSSNELRRFNYSTSYLESPKDTFNCSVSFKGKKEVLKQAVEISKKSFSDKVADNKVTKKTLNSGFFSKVLDVTAKQEVFAQAASALAICCALRPATLLAFPGKKDKKDCQYAAAHSISSGLWGLVVPFFFVTPLVGGVNYALKHPEKFLKDKTLKKMYPHLDMKSVYKKLENGKFERKPLTEWADKSGRAFVTDVKNVRNTFTPKHISQISEETLKDKIKDIDIKSIYDSSSKRVSANNWKDTKGNPINVAFDDIYICLKDTETKKHKYYPLKHVNTELLQESYPNLDTKTITSENGLRLTPDKWKQSDGKPFVLDKDSIFISDARESEDTIAITAGFTQKMSNGKTKDIYYQKNNKNSDDLGTPITDEMIEADKVNTIKNKLSGWLPEIVTVYPKASVTIGLIPFILGVLGIKKDKQVKKQDNGNAIGLAQGINKETNISKSGQKKSFAGESVVANRKSTPPGLSDNPQPASNNSEPLKSRFYQLTQKSNTGKVVG